MFGFLAWSNQNAYIKHIFKGFILVILTLNQRVNTFVSVQQCFENFKLCSGIKKKENRRGEGEKRQGDKNWRYSNTTDAF